MKLRPALMMASGPPGVWLIDEANETKFTITITPHDKGVNPLVIKTLAATIVDAFPEEGIEVPG